MVKGRIGRIARIKARRAYRGAKRMPRRKLLKSYAQVSGKLVAVTALKNRRRKGRRPIRRIGRRYGRRFKRRRY